MVGCLNCSNALGLVCVTISHRSQGTGNSAGESLAPRRCILGNSSYLPQILQSPLGHAGAETTGRAMAGADAAQGVRSVMIAYTAGTFLCAGRCNGGCACHIHCCALLQNLAGLLDIEQLGRWEELELAQSLQKMPDVVVLPALQQRLPGGRPELRAVPQVLLRLLQPLQRVLAPRH